MRQRQTILRQIAEQNLDPTVAHVSGKNGLLVPKKPHSKTEEKTHHHHHHKKEVDHKAEEKKSLPEAVVEELPKVEETQLPEETKEVAADLPKDEQPVPEVVAAVPPPAKNFPPKKKKPAVTDE